MKSFKNELIMLKRIFFKRIFFEVETTSKKCRRFELNIWVSFSWPRGNCVPNFLEGGKPVPFSFVDLVGLGLQA
jgi:hypothetical protein